MTQLNSHQFEEVYKILGINLDTLGCIMLDIKPIEATFIDDNILYYAKDKKKFWINGYVFNKTAHLTLLYGLLESGLKQKKLIDVVLNGWRMDSIEVEAISSFDSPYKDEPYYCIVAKVKTTDNLLEGHRRLEFLPHINTFTGYKPHLTLAYIKKDLRKRGEIIADFYSLLVAKKLEVKGINYGK